MYIVMALLIASAQALDTTGFFQLSTSLSGANVGYKLADDGRSVHLWLTKSVAGMIGFALGNDLGDASVLLIEKDTHAGKIMLRECTAKGQDNLDCRDASQWILAEPDSFNVTGSSLSVQVKRRVSSSSGKDFAYGVNKVVAFHMTSDKFATDYSTGGISTTAMNLKYTAFSSILQLICPTFVFFALN